MQGDSRKARRVVCLSAQLKKNKKNVQKICSIEKKTLPL